MRIAVIGGGIAGLSCAWTLERHLRDSGLERHHVTLFEANDYLGGHAHTVDVCLDTPEGPVSHGVDTGFLVFNERTYPGLTRLFAALQVPIAASDMSLSISLPDRDLEWAGSNLSTLFAQRRNLLRPGFLRMVRDILRFNRLASGSALAVTGSETLGDFLARHGFSNEFREWYLLPMIGSIWSCPTRQMLTFPVSTLIRFCHNHGLLQLRDRPQWLTVRGGSREYVQRMTRDLRDVRMEAVISVRRLPSTDQETSHVEVTTATGNKTHFDHVVLACHSDQALALLDDASNSERALLRAIRYQPNRAVLHTDSRLLPKRPVTWSAWNYTALPDGDQTRVCVHYFINKLQPLPSTWNNQPVIVSLNPVVEPTSDRILREFEYAHPVFDNAAIDAQSRLPDIQGKRHTWFCGAWTGYGFHEDGLASGVAVAGRLLPLLAGEPRVAPTIHSECGVT